MKHKYAEMIKVRVDNMALVLLVNTDGEWRDSSNDLPVSNGFDYFLCHPKHETAVRHVLNGGEIELKGEYHEREVKAGEIGAWSKGMWYMREDMESRIKPKKEKRWIIVSKNPGSGIGAVYNQCIGAYKFKSDAVELKNRLSNQNLQIVEIEIETD